MKRRLTAIVVDDDDEDDMRTKKEEVKEKIIVDKIKPEMMNSNQQKKKAKPKLAKKTTLQSKEDFFKFVPFMKTEHENFSVEKMLKNGNEAQGENQVLRQLTLELSDSEDNLAGISEVINRKRSLTPPPANNEEDDENIKCDVIIRSSFPGKKIPKLQLDEEGLLCDNEVSSLRNSLKDYTVEIQVRPFASFKNSEEFGSLDFSLKSNETFSCIMEQYAHKFHQNSNELVFLYSKVAVSSYNTPKGLGLQGKTTFEVITKSSYQDLMKAHFNPNEASCEVYNDEEDYDSEEEEESITLILSRNGDKVPLVVSAKTTLNEIESEYRQLKNLSEETNITLKFDGEVIKDMTVGELDLEDNDLIDVILI